MENVNRPVYFKKLLDFKDKPIIKIVTGVRRCGKSTLLDLFKNHLLQSGVESSQIIYLNFEDYDNKSLRNPDNLYSYIKSVMSPDKMNYFIFDEIQIVEDFTQIIDSLYIKNNADVYITGSNADLLSSEIATLISGRYVEIKMLPLSFLEYSTFENSISDTQKLYVDYTRFGSFPFVPSLEKRSDLIYEYLQSLYNTIVLKDVVARNKIADVLMLQSLVEFIFDNIGNPVSSKSIADAMTSNGRKIDTKTVERYLKCLEESFIIYKAKRYDVKGKQYLKSLGKYYVVDPGFRMMLLGTRKFDSGRVLENIIYLELLRRHSQVYIGKCDNLEIDFVAIDEGGLSYYQIAETVREPETLARELKPLQSLSDNYPKYLLTLDVDAGGDYDGIRKINAIDWLLGNAF